VTRVFCQPRLGPRVCVRVLSTVFLSEPEETHRTKRRAYRRGSRDVERMVPHFSYGPFTSAVRVPPTDSRRRWNSVRAIAMGQLSPWMTEFETADGRWLRTQASFPTLQKRLAKALGTSVDVYSSGPSGPVSRRLSASRWISSETRSIGTIPRKARCASNRSGGRSLVVDAAARVSVGTRG
jgi:hypothetical protein